MFEAINNLTFDNIEIKQRLAETQAGLINSIKKINVNETDITNRIGKITTHAKRNSKAINRMDADLEKNTLEHQPTIIIGNNIINLDIMDIPTIANFSSESTKINVKNIYNMDEDFLIEVEITDGGASTATFFYKSEYDEYKNIILKKIDTTAPTPYKTFTQSGTNGIYDTDTEKVIFRNETFLGWFNMNIGNVETKYIITYCYYNNNPYICVHKFDGSAHIMLQTSEAITNDNIKNFKKYNDVSLTASMTNTNERSGFVLIDNYKGNSNLSFCYLIISNFTIDYFAYTPQITASGYIDIYYNAANKKYYGVKKTSNEEIAIDLYTIYNLIISATKQDGDMTKYLVEKEMDGEGNTIYSVDIDLPLITEEIAFPGIFSISSFKDFYIYNSIISRYVDICSEFSERKLIRGPTIAKIDGNYLDIYKPSLTNKKEPDESKYIKYGDGEHSFTIPGMSNVSNQVITCKGNNWIFLTSSISDGSDIKFNRCFLSREYNDVYLWNIYDFLFKNNKETNIYADSDINYFNAVIFGEPSISKSSGGTITNLTFPYVVHRCYPEDMIKDFPKDGTLIDINEATDKTDGIILKSSAV